VTVLGLTLIHSLESWTYSSLTVMLITSRHGPRRKHRSSVALQLLFVSRSLPSSGFTRHITKTRDSSVGIVTRLGAEDWVMPVSSPAGARDF
jgi:hypothetical protein